MASGGYDYIFTVGADASAIAKEVSAQMQNAQSIVSGTELIVKLNGEKSAKDFLNQIKSLKPEAEVVLKTDKKSAEQMMKNLGNPANLVNKSDRKDFERAINDLNDYANKKLSGVNLTSIFQDVTKGISDPTKSFQDLFRVIQDARSEMEALADVSNNAALRNFNEAQLDQTAKLAMERMEAQRKLNEAQKEADKKVDEYGMDRATLQNILSTRNTKEYSKSAVAKAAQSILGNKADYNTLSTADKNLLDEYVKTSNYLQQQLEHQAGAAYTNPQSKAQAENYLKSSKEIFDIYKQADKLQTQVAEKFGIPQDSKNLLLGNEGFDIQKTMNDAIRQYTQFSTKQLQNQYLNANKNLQNYIGQNAQKSAEKSAKDAVNAQEKAQSNIEKANKKVKGGGGTGTSGTGGTGGAGEVATGMEGVAEGYRRSWRSCNTIWRSRR